MSYQKDGPGRLLRCYLDRIHQRPKVLQENTINANANANAQFCQNCHEQLGIYYIYAKENRPAYDMLEEKSYFFRVAEDNF